MINSKPDDDFIKGLFAKEAKMKDEIAVKKQEISVIEKQMAAVKRVIDAFENIKYGIEAKAKIVLPEGYSKNLTWSEKVLWATNAIGGGFVDEIAESISVQEPELDKKAIKGMVTQYASQLKKSGNLQYKKAGKKYRYYL